MRIKDFDLERYFAKHEFTAKYLLSSSDCDGIEMDALLGLASKEELQQWESLKLGYTESQGDPQLREKIASFYQCNADQVLVASPGELNFITMNVLLQKGDHVVCMSPAYQSLYEVVRSIGCDLSYWKPRNDRWEYHVADLENLMTRTDANAHHQFSAQSDWKLPETKRSRATHSIGS